MMSFSSDIHISLLYVPYKILEKLLHNCLTPVIDLHQQWSTVDQQWSTVDQQWSTVDQQWSTVDRITLLTQDIEDSFQLNEKAGVVLLDLIARLHLKLLKTIPDKQMVSFIMEISFTLMTSNGQQNRLRRLKNGFQQGSGEEGLRLNDIGFI